jgi:hypothetical protein
MYGRRTIKTFNMQEHVHALRDFVDQKLSLEPIHAAIKDLLSAAYDAFTEGEVTRGI